MPLQAGQSHETISHNVRTEYHAIRAKHPDWPKKRAQRQAVAIAMSKSRES